MKRVFARLATTHLDKQGERMALSALESMASHIAKTHVPIGIEHDPRVPPIGRIATASVVQLTEEEYAVEGELEVFESEEEVPLAPEGREVPSLSSPPDAVVVSSDYQFRNAEDERDIRALADLHDTAPGYEIKKSADPLAVLTLQIGAFLLGGIAVGFLERSGEDLYERSKEILKRIFQRRNSLPEETLLRVIGTVRREGAPAFEIELISSRPTDQVIDALLSYDLGLIDRALNELIETSAEIRRIVFEERNGEISVSFAVRRDAVPLFPHLRVDGEVRQLIFKPYGRGNRVRLGLIDKS